MIPKYGHQLRVDIIVCKCGKAFATQLVSVVFISQQFSYVISKEITITSYYINVIFIFQLTVNHDNVNCESSDGETAI